MNLTYSTLARFERERKAAGLIPPAGSNSFYNIGDGQINLYTRRSEKDNYRFDVSVESGIIDIGEEQFNLAGDINNIENPYASMVVNDGTGINISNIFGVYQGELISYGVINIQAHGYLVVRNNGKVILHKNSSLIIEKNFGLQISDDSQFIIYGNIYIDLYMVDTLLNAPNITIDPAAVMFVEGLDTLGTRIFSLTDYFVELSNQVINANTQGERNFVRSVGRFGYVWTGGDPRKRYQILKLSLLFGNGILGDFKLAVLGIPETELKDTQIIDTLVIESDCTLHITEEHETYKYSHPQLYIGRIIDNCDTPGRCIVDGNIVVTGINSKIVIDRGAQLIIEDGATVSVSDDAKIMSTNNDGIEVLFINGKLIIDSIEQIETFNADQIVFGDNGKLIIRNPDTGDRKILFSTPISIEGSLLYRLMRGRLNHVEYHISNNTGIEIDKYYEFFSKDFTNWYDGMRIEKAIHDGLIVWHDGGFMKLSSSIIPWINDRCNLLHASKLFKSVASMDYDRLQEVINRLKYAGCGNITFIFEYEYGSHEITLVLDEVNMLNIINNPMSNSYELSTDNSGELFLKNNLAVVKPENIITKDATMINISETGANFQLK